MSDDFAPIRNLVRDLMQSLSASERRALLRRMATTIRATQTERIAAQRDADGSAFAPRRVRAEPKPGAYPVRFLYPKGAAEPRTVFMKSWVTQGPLMTGFDIEAGGLRSFFRDRVAQWLPLPEGEGAGGGGGGRLRRPRRIRQQAMFRKLGSARHLRAGSTEGEAWVGFTGRAAAVARVHQEGRMDAPKLGARKVRYAARQLLGLTDRDRTAALDLLFDHIADR